MDPSHLRQDIEALAVALHYDRREVDIDAVGRAVQWRYSRPWRGATRTGVKTALRFAKISLLRALQP